MTDVQVINSNKMKLVGRYNGTYYEFPPGRPVSVPEKAAAHIFGWAETDKTGALNRLGLLMPNDPRRTLEEATKALNRVSFAQGHTVFEGPPLTFKDPESQPPSQPIGESLDAQRNPGGESGVEGQSSTTDALSPVERDASWTRSGV